MVFSTFPPLAFFLLLLLTGCAHRQSAVIPEDSVSRLEEVDSILQRTLGDYLPPAAIWPPREFSSQTATLSARVIQSLPVSSLAYFPRLSSRLETALEAAGFEGVELQLTTSGEDNFCFLTIPAAPALTYEIELQQKVRGRIALIIDDLGQTLEEKELLGRMDYPLTVAILPRLPHTADWDREASEKGFEILLHCPLEPINPAISPGPGVITRETSPEDADEILSENLKELPHAVGVNNHMGSAFTTDPEAMRRLLGNIKARGLFFVDSLTVAGTATREAAAGVDIPFASRDTFLDHENSEEFILAQFEELKQKAKGRGRAVAIGHYRPLTLELLQRELPTLADDGIQIVPVSDLVK